MVSSHCPHRRIWYAALAFNLVHGLIDWFVYSISNYLLSWGWRHWWGRGAPWAAASIMLKQIPWAFSGEWPRALPPEHLMHTHGFNFATRVTRNVSFLAFSSELETSVPRCLLGIFPWLLHIHPTFKVPKDETYSLPTHLSFLLVLVSAKMTWPAISLSSPKKSWESSLSCLLFLFQIVSLSPNPVNFTPLTISLNDQLLSYPPTPTLVKDTILFHLEDDDSFCLPSGSSEAPDQFILHPTSRGPFKIAKILPPLTIFQVLPFTLRMITII